jgi:predicted glycoside hydrolase/deacetylase ChbG (UPF0249 family)
MKLINNRKLIINADDFGLLPEVNRGIIECFQTKSISSTTLMVNAEGTQEAVDLAKTHPSLGVGLHFNLTHGSPVCEPEKIPSLVNGKGSFHSRTEFEKKIILGKILFQDIEKEFKAQLQKFDKSGLEMTHIDSHHHVHIFPSVFKIVSSYTVEMGLPLRIPWVSYRFVKPTIKLKGYKAALRKLLLHYLIPRKSSLSVKAILTPNNFLSIYDYIPCPFPILSEHYLTLINSVSNGILELMAHPAYVTSKLKRIFTDAHIKEMERSTLVSFSLVELAEKTGFKVISFKQISEA